MNRLRVVGLCLLLPWTLPFAAWGAPPVVVYGPELDAVRAAVAARDATGTATFQIAGPLADWTGSAAAAPVVLGAASRGCAEPGGPSLAATLVEVKRHLFDMDYAVTLDLLRAAEARLPCGAERASTPELYALQFLTGLSEFNDGRVDAAKLAFARAAAISPERPWDPAHAPTPTETYLGALQSVIARPPTALLSEVGGLMVDGGPSTASPPPLLRGGHLIAFGDTPLWVEVGELPVLVTTAGQLRDGLLSGQERYAPWLAALAEREGWTDVLLVDGKRAARFRGGRFVPPNAEPETAATPQAPALALLVAGGSAAAAGFVISGAAYTQGDRVNGVAGQRAQYTRHQGANRAGLVLGVVGAAAAAAGLVWSIVHRVGDPTPAAFIPWLAPGPAGVAFGVVGSLP